MVNGVTAVADPHMGPFHLDGLAELTDIALQCASHASAARPPMAQVVTDLQRLYARHGGGSVGADGVVIKRVARREARNYLFSSELDSVEWAEEGEGGRGDGDGGEGGRDSNHYERNGSWDESVDLDRGGSELGSMWGESKEGLGDLGMSDAGVARHILQSMSEGGGSGRVGGGERQPHVLASVSEGGWSPNEFLSFEDERSTNEVHDGFGVRYNENRDSESLLNPELLLGGREKSLVPKRLH